MKVLLSPASCVILVPVAGTIDPRCEMGLAALERRGYTVRRAQGFSAIDFGRSVLASNALDDGFDELLWIDSDIIFHHDDVEKLRAHEVPVACGIYAKKAKGEFACEFLPGTRQLVFGKGGGLVEIRYAGCGFMLTRRAAYEQMRQRLGLPECNQRFGRPIVPYFLPMLVADGAGQWYLSEDYAFCERARQCGLRILADSSIRLAHIGSYPNTWEDVGRGKEQFASYTCNFNWPAEEALSAEPARRPG
jgi:hypothetical protein